MDPIDRPRRRRSRRIISDARPWGVWNGTASDWVSVFSSALALLLPPQPSGYPLRSRSRSVYLYASLRAQAKTGRAGERPAMTSRTRSGILIFALAQGLAGCSGSPSGPSIPQSSPQVSQPLPAPRGPVAPPVFSPDVTLSGLVFEETLTGRAPIEDVGVYCEACGAETHTWANTDSNGFYSFTGVWMDSGQFPTRILIHKDGYLDPPGLSRPTPPNPSGPGWREVVITGDTQLDAQLVPHQGLRPRE
jgi:hypothetical protein